MVALIVIPAFCQTQVTPQRAPARSQVARIKPQLATYSSAFGDTVLPQVADGGGWQTSITVLNLRTTPTTFSIYCFNDSGSPDEFPWNGIGTSAVVGGTLPGSGSITAQTAGTASATTQGWCEVESPGETPSDETENDVAAFAIFSYLPTHQEVSVAASCWYIEHSLILAYDNTNGYGYGVALVDSAQTVPPGQGDDTVDVSIADQNGNQIATDSFPIAPGSHQTFMLADKYPAVANTKGTVTLSMRTTSGWESLSGLGLRFAPSGAITSVGMFEAMTY